MWWLRAEREARILVPLGSPGERAGGWGVILSTMLTHEPATVWRGGNRKLSTITFLEDLENFLKNVTSQVKARSKIKTVTFRLMGY